MILQTISKDIETEFGINLKSIKSSLEFDDKDDKLVTPFEESDRFLVIAQRSSHQDDEAIVQV